MATTKPGNLNPDNATGGSVTFGGSNVRAAGLANRAAGVGARARALSLTTRPAPYTPSSSGKANLTIPASPLSKVIVPKVGSTASTMKPFASPFKGTAINDYWNALKKIAK
jgi:hypothetical protein